MTDRSVGSEALATLVNASSCVSSQLPLLLDMELLADDDKGALAAAASAIF